MRLRAALSVGGRSVWVLILTLAFAVGLGAAAGASFTSAIVTNSVNSAVTGSLAFKHAWSSTTCEVLPRTTTTVPSPCTGSIEPTAATVASPGTVSLVDSITNTGTLPASRLTSEFRGLSCAPVQYANQKTAANVMMPRYNTTFLQPDKWGTNLATTLDGTNAYGSAVLSEYTATAGSTITSPSSMGIWFKVANGYTGGGGLLSFDASPSNATSAAGSPMIWMDNTGKIRFRVTGTLGTSISNVSAAAYNNGAWHFAQLLLTGAGTVTANLYVDGAAAVSATGLTLLTGVAGYWHMGWADFTGSPTGTPTSAYLAGSLTGAYVRTATMSTGDRNTLFNATSSSDYQTKALALTNLAHLWMYNDDGKTTYSGSHPVIGATSPCTMVDIEWTTTNPAGTVAAAGTKLSAFANGTFHAVTAPAPGTTQVSTIKASRDATYNTYVSGLRLRVPLEHRVSSAPGTAWSVTFAWNDFSSVFIA